MGRELQGSDVTGHWNKDVFQDCFIKTLEVSLRMLQNHHSLSNTNFPVSVLMCIVDSWMTNAFIGQVTEAMVWWCFHDVKDYLCFALFLDSKGKETAAMKADLLRARNVKRYINQLTVAKKQCEKRIRLLGGPAYDQQEDGISDEGDGPQSQKVWIE